MLLQYVTLLFLVHQKVTQVTSFSRNVAVSYVSHKTIFAGSFNEDFASSPASAAPHLRGNRVSPDSAFLHLPAEAQTGDHNDSSLHSTAAPLMTTVVAAESLASLEDNENLAETPLENTATDARDTTSVATVYVPPSNSSSTASAAPISEVLDFPDVSVLYRFTPLKESPVSGEGQQPKEFQFLDDADSEENFIDSFLDAADAPDLPNVQAVEPGLSESQEDVKKDGNHVDAAVRPLLSVVNKHFSIIGPQTRYPSESLDTEADGAAVEDIKTSKEAPREHDTRSASSISAAPIVLPVDSLAREATSPNTDAIQTSLDTIQPAVTHSDTGIGGLSNHIISFVDQHPFTALVSVNVTSLPPTDDLVGSTVAPSLSEEYLTASTVAPFPGDDVVASAVASLFPTRRDVAISAVMPIASDEEAPVSTVAPLLLGEDVLVSTAAPSLPEEDVLVSTAAPSLPEEDVLVSTAAPSLPEEDVLVSTAAPSLPEEDVLVSTAAPLLPEEDVAASTAAPVLAEEDVVVSTSVPSLPEEDIVVSTSAPLFAEEDVAASTAAPFLSEDVVVSTTAAASLPEEDVAASTTAASLPEEDVAASTAETSRLEDVAASAASALLPEEDVTASVNTSSLSEEDSVASTSAPLVAEETPVALNVTPSPESALTMSVAGLSNSIIEGGDVQGETSSGVSNAGTLSNDGELHKAAVAIKPPLTLLETDTVPTDKLQAQKDVGLADVVPDVAESDAADVFSEDSELKNVVSKPDVGTAGEPQQNFEDTPSNAAAVPEYISKAIHDAEARPNCSHVVHSYYAATAHMGRNGRNWIEAFRSLLSTAAAPLYKDSDKDAEASLLTLGMAFRHSRTVDFSTLHKLTTCDVDGITGRTVLMKLIERGFILTLKHDTTWNILTPTAYGNLISYLDEEGNNLLHIAVLSRSNVILNEVISRLEEKLSPDQLKKYFDAVNMYNRRPLDLARETSMPAEMIVSLSNFYRALYYGKGSSQNRRQTLTGYPRPMDNFEN